MPFLALVVNLPLRHPIWQAHSAMDKSAWRHQVLQRRSALPDAGSYAGGQLASAPGLVGCLPGMGESVACYLSTGSEPDTAALLQLLVERGLVVLLPAPGPTRRAIKWGMVTPATCALPVSPPGGLPQPPPPYLGAKALGQCQLVLVPALAVDRSGTRLGRGGGWYDRALAEVAPGALVLAVVYPSEVLPAGALPREAHDVPVDGVLTSAGAVLFNSPGPPTLMGGQPTWFGTGPFAG